MRTSRQLHLWIGLLTSFLILIEAVTGLIMMEPQLLGLETLSHGQRGHFDRAALAEEGNFANEEPTMNLLGYVKGLHSGRIGDTDVSLLLEILAIGLIILTITGMIMSIKRLKAQYRR